MFVLRKTLFFYGQKIFNLLLEISVLILSVNVIVNDVNPNSI